VQYGIDEEVGHCLCRKRSHLRDLSYTQDALTRRNYIRMLRIENSFWQRSGWGETTRSRWKRWHEPAVFELNEGVVLVRTEADEAADRSRRRSLGLNTLYKVRYLRSTGDVYLNLVIKKTAVVSASCMVCIFFCWQAVVLQQQLKLTPFLGTWRGNLLDNSGCLF
jgi:hypothetical protein